VVERGQSRRWEVTPEEERRIAKARQAPMSARTALTLLAQSPRLVPEVARDLARHAVRGIWSSSALVWTLDSERVRRAVPDVARGIGFTDEGPFLSYLLPRLNATQRVLDVGGGDGRLSRHVAPSVAEVVVSDISPTMVAEAAENLASFGNVQTHLARGFTLEPLAAGSFDLVFAQGVLPYLDVNEGLALLDEMARVTKPGGTVIVNAFTFDRPEWAEAQVEAVRMSARRGRFTAGLFRSYVESQVEAMVRAVGYELVETGYGDDPAEKRLPYVVVGTRS
jgi:SAM-dependent methyltransferase